jgi:hypothetical protein
MILGRLLIMSKPLIFLLLCANSHRTCPVPMSHTELSYSVDDAGHNEALTGLRKKMKPVGPALLLPRDWTLVGRVFSESTSAVMLAASMVGRRAWRALGVSCS